MRSVYRESNSRVVIVFWDSDLIPQLSPHSVSCALTARFLLHLRQWDDKAVGATRPTAPGHSTTDLRFARPSQLTTENHSETADVPNWRAKFSKVMNLKDFEADPVPRAVRDIKRQAEREEQRNSRKERRFSVLAVEERQGPWELNRMTTI